MIDIKMMILERTLSIEEKRELIEAYTDYVWLKKDDLFWEIDSEDDEEDFSEIETLHDVIEFILSIRESRAFVRGENNVKSDLRKLLDIK